MYSHLIISVTLITYFIPKTHLHHTKFDHGMCLCMKYNINNKNMAIEWYPKKVVVGIKLYLMNIHTLLYTSNHRLDCASLFIGYK